MNEEDKKRFDLWNIEKQKLCDVGKLDYLIRQREIWYLKMGQNIGYEENGKYGFRRPVLVVKKVGNMYFTVALTSQGKTDNLFYYKLQNAYFDKKHNYYLGESYVILSQARVLDTRRFINRIGKVDRVEFAEITKRLKTLLF